MLLFGAHYTVEFFVLVIRWAGKMAMVTSCFSVVEGNTISVSMTVRQGLLVLVHTLKHGAPSDATGSSLVLGHEVSIVLPGPGGRAAVFSWDHHHSWSSGHVTHSTRYIVVVCSLEGILILCPIYLCGISIVMVSLSISVSECGAVLWVLRHTQVVGSTSFLAYPGTSSDARVD